MKSEPGTYGIDDLERDGKTEWDGVRNYQARNFMRDSMRPGDLVLFYHSRVDPGVVGVGEVVSEAYADPTQFDPKSPYHDPKSNPDDPRWQLVDVGYRETLPQPVSLPAMKEDPALEGMLVIKKGMRLSVQPVDKAHFKHVLRLGGARTKVR